MLWGTGIEGAGGTWDKNASSRVIEKAEAVHRVLCSSLSLKIP